MLQILFSTQIYQLILCIVLVFTANASQENVAVPGNGRFNVILTLKNSTTPVLESVKSLHFPDRVERLNVIVRKLKEFTRIDQMNIHNFLQVEQHHRGFKVDVVWATNQIVIWGADADLIGKLVTKFEEVERIEEERFIPVADPLDLSVMNASSKDIATHHWGVADIDASLVWNEGIRGEGIVVATIDTGVRYTHESLRANFIEDYGWYSPANKTATPTDANGHGTHTMGTIVGSTFNIGVAPGSKWMSCQGCHEKSCSDIILILCGQWMVCPTRPDGRGADCSRAPHLVSNSWGGDAGNPWYAGIVRAWRAVGIIPLFSAGNSGPGCGTSNSPGDYESVISIGSTMRNGSVSGFSSVGPRKKGGNMKPDVAAPGSKILSASFVSDSSYAIMSGTSMACPHAAGVIALLLSKHPNMSYNQVKEALVRGSVRTISKGAECSGVPDHQFPNYHAGAGKINAAKVVQST